ncbi:MAG: glycosyltransferase family 1 protein [Peptococcaceae bacterium]|nr:glycosyltransferase family 1 protein [Peptococcaceae bacterium]
MKIGIDARAAIWYRGTGIGTYTYQLIRNLAYLDTSNVYRFFWPGDEYKDLDPRTDAVFNSILKHKDRFWEEVHIPAALEDDKINVYHVPQNGIGLPVKKDCPFIVTVHDLIPYVYPETVGRNYLKVFLQEMPRIIEDADQIITVSDWSKRDIQKIFKLPDDRITVTYEAAEEIYRPLDKNKCRDFLANKYNLPRRFVLYLGGFGPRKNISGLINAFFELKKDLDADIKLVIVGKPGRDFEELNLLVDALGIQERVIFPGFVPVEELPLFYNAATIFVYPSIYEGFGLPPIEAMACGTPTITSNTSSIPEVVGDGAVLINPFNSLDLAEGIFRLLTDEALARQCTAKGLAQAKQYSWHTTAQQTLTTYLRFA